MDFLSQPALGIPVMGIILWAVEREPWRSSAESMDYIGAFIVALAADHTHVRIKSGQCLGTRVFKVFNIYRGFNRPGYFVCDL